MRTGFQWFPIAAGIATVVTICVDEAVDKISVITQIRITFYMHTAERRNFEVLQNKLG